MTWLIVEERLVRVGTERGLGPIPSNGGMTIGLLAFAIAIIGEYAAELNVLTNMSVWSATHTIRPSYVLRGLLTLFQRLMLLSWQVIIQSRSDQLKAWGIL